MLNKLIVVCGVGIVLLTAGAAAAQTATQEAKEKTKAATEKTATVMNDAEITAAVKTKLLADKTVGGLKIDVDTSDGVVTLTGPVHSGIERSQALRLARNTKGVKRVVNKLDMEKTAATAGRTEKIKEDSKAAAGKVKDTSVDVAGKVKDKSVDVAGKVKDKSVDAAGATKNAGEKTADKSKDVASKTGEVITDASITTAVKTKLLADSKVGGLKIDVDTTDHVVTLTGPVNSVEEKNEALRLARTTTGVRRVIDKLTVK
jgi:hyperosmotically inducible periplasmic protein